MDAEGKQYYNDFLEKPFSETLNWRRPQDESPWGSIPYLDGGLFERDHDFFLNIPNELFDPQANNSVLGFFNNYNFTVEEDMLLEQHVALGPDLLSEVFENLLEEAGRGKAGTASLKRSMTRYVCREALLDYLHGVTQLDRSRLQAQSEEALQPALTAQEASTVESALRVCLILLLEWARS